MTRRPATRNPIPMNMIGSIMRCSYEPSIPGVAKNAPHNATPSARVPASTGVNLDPRQRYRSILTIDGRRRRQAAATREAKAQNGFQVAVGVNFR
jgi:hypothetical protein